MDNDTAYCINSLVEVLERGDDGEAVYSGSEAINKRDQLLPIIIEKLDIDSEGPRISSEKLERELSDLLLEVKGADDPAQEVEGKISEFRDGLYDRNFNEYAVAFPLNFDSNSSELLPESRKIGDVVFERLSRSNWSERFVPDCDDLTSFVEKSPNELDNPRFTYWFATYNARGARYALNHVISQLEVMLGMMNYSATFNRVQAMSYSSGPWPDRWGELREPFVYLLHGEDGFLSHYGSRDASLRKSDSPHSNRVDSFRSLFNDMPTFEEEQSLDGRLLNSLTAFQTAITEPSNRESFFEFWRGVEILTLVEEGESMSKVIDRAAAIIDSKDSELNRIKQNRAQNKRNSHVHEGARSRLTAADRNFVKSLHESLISLYVDKRGDWGYEKMKFALEQFTVDGAQIENLRRSRNRELQLIDWFEEISKLN